MSPLNQKPLSRAPSATQILGRRIREGSQPGQRKRGDQAHLALAVEGGGMRGVVSAAMLVTLEHLGALGAFDSVWGSSAGSINGAYFITGQSDEGSPVYYDHLPGNNFINPRRFARGGDFMSLDFLFHVMTHVIPLDWRRLTTATTTLHPLAFCLEDWQTVDLGHPRTRDELFLRLRASSQVPLFAGEPVVIGDKHYLDAACGEFIPVPAALRGGATHVVALHTRPRGLTAQPLSRVERTLYRRRLTPVDPRLVEYQENRVDIYREQMTAVEALGERVFSIYPTGSTDPLSATDHSREAVLHGYQLGLRAALQAWSQVGPQVGPTPLSDRLEAHARAAQRQGRQQAAALRSQAEGVYRQARQRFSADVLPDEA
jgi:predicted patatin/cPLA2 family phospholipase